MAARAIEADVHALLRFDVAALGPTGRIARATSSVWTDEQEGCGVVSGGAVEIHELVEAWDEGAGSENGALGIANFVERRGGRCRMNHRVHDRTPWELSELTSVVR